MKWITEWWGIQIIAETDDDEKLLKELKSKLDDNAFTHYEDGEMKEATEMMYGNLELKPKYILEFSR